jgi:hypothetical protein
MIRLSFLWRAVVVAASLHAGAACAASQAPLPNVAPQKTVGTVNCASSTCHGSVTPWNDSPVLQNEYTTWSRLDRHAKAYSVLRNERSRRIAKNLGLPQPAHESKLCLDCHAHNPAPAQRGERHVVAEGVGCEACHGPAEKWIGPHTAPGASHAQNIANGMYPTERPAAQATLCLSCHFGDGNRSVTHRIMGAGHPRMSFEIDTFAAIAPAHYRIDDDWKKRKGEYDSIKIWAIGQALAAKQLLDTLADPVRGRDGLFPELVLFDCQSCHHPMSERKWSPRLGVGVGPGRMRLNDSNLLILRAIVHVVSPATSDAFNAQIRQLHLAISGGAQARGADPIALAKALSSTIDGYVPRFEATRFDLAVLRQVLGALIAEAEGGNFSDYAGAEQAYMAISTVASSLVRQGGIRSADEVNRRLAAMRTLLANEDKFKPDAFAVELAAMRDLAGAQKKGNP